jgi:hypothetical protein
MHFAPVAQLDRALACGAKGRRFESCRVYQIKSLSHVLGLFIFVRYTQRHTYTVVTGGYNEHTSKHTVQKREL